MLKTCHESVVNAIHERFREPWTPRQCDSAKWGFMQWEHNAAFDRTERDQADAVKAMDRRRDREAKWHIIHHWGAVTERLAYERGWYLFLFSDLVGQRCKQRRKSRRVAELALERLWLKRPIQAWLHLGQHARQKIRLVRCARLWQARRLSVSFVRFSLTCENLADRRENRRHAHKQWRGHCLRVFAKQWRDAIDRGVWHDASVKEGKGNSNRLFKLFFLSRWMTGYTHALRMRATLDVLTARRNSRDTVSAWVKWLEAHPPFGPRWRADGIVRRFLLRRALVPYWRRAMKVSFIQASLTPL